MKISLLTEEIKWCESHRGGNKEYEDGFIAGLKQAIYLLRDAELHVHPTTEQKCPYCLGEGVVWQIDSIQQCGVCLGTGISNRSGGG